MKRALVLVALLLVVLAPSTHAYDTRAKVTRYWTNLWNQNYLQNYGCSDQPATKLRPAFMVQQAKRLWERAGYPLTIMTSNTTYPQDSDYTKWRLANEDGIRLLVRDYAAASNKPRLSFSVRPDVRRPAFPPSSGNSRTSEGYPGCDPGSNSYQSQTARGCLDDSIPMCVGGTHANYWCRFHDGVAVDNATDCPGGGTCELVPLNWAWALTLPVATHEAQLASFDYATGSLELFCDGRDYGTVAMNVKCGSDYPAGPGGNARPTGMPTNSVGYKLSEAQDVAGVAWPLTHLPVYYGDPVKSCATGTEIGKFCTIDGNCAGPGTCSATKNSVAPAYVGMDLRIAAYQWWAAAAVLDKAYQSLRYAGASDAQIQNWPILPGEIDPKPGIWTHYDPARYPADKPICTGATQDGTHMWTGPLRPDLTDAVDCMAGGGPSLIHNTPYGPGEFETATSDLAFKLLRQTTDNRMCSAGSGNPYHLCASNADCEQGGTCSAAAANFWNDVLLAGSVNPNFRNRPGATASVALRKHERYVGPLSVVYEINDPYTNGSLNEEQLCATAPTANAGGPYDANGGGPHDLADGTVRLTGSCIGLSSITASWAATDCTGCLFVDPYDKATPATTDPQALLVGVPASPTTKTITLTCGAATSVATITGGLTVGTECNDGLDNDADHAIDYPADTGCTSAVDAGERGSVVCDNGSDDDSDTLSDFPADPGCANIADTSERGTRQCDDGVNNDSSQDSNTDYPADTGCGNPWDVNEFYTGECADGLDNDTDGQIDNGYDSGCASVVDDTEGGACGDGTLDPGEHCDDGNVTNGDGCSSTCGVTVACSDGVDNDGDGLTDWSVVILDKDPGCDSAVDDSEKGTRQCDDGFNNDVYNDANIDMADSFCGSPWDTSELESTVCCDGLDNDSDGTYDSGTTPGHDVGCFLYYDTTETHGTVECDDGIDNDLDGRTDWYMSSIRGDLQCTSFSDTSETTP